MTYVVTEACIRCKYQDCIEVCPVECFHAGENMLVINPDVCIDCGVCVPECPVEAIIPDTHPDAEKWIELNRLYSVQDSDKKWPSILEKGDVPNDADDFRDVANKFEQYFNENPDPNVKNNE